MTETSERRFPPGVEDPRIQPWLLRLKGAQYYQKPENPSLQRRARHQYWRVRDGFKLYLFNHVVNRIPSHTARLAIYRRVFDIGRNTSILLDFEIFATKRLIIGRNSTVGEHCTFDSRAGILIGNNVSIGNYVQIWTGGHDVNSAEFMSSGGVVIVEDYAFVASSAIVISPMGGRTLTIGEGAVVAAGAVVVRDVPPYTVVAGNPARKFAKRNPDVDYELNYFPYFR